jgi:hypothetical protein
MLGATNVATCRDKRKVKRLKSLKTFCDTRDISRHTTVFVATKRNVASVAENAGIFS